MAQIAGGGASTPNQPGVNITEMLQLARSGYSVAGLANRYGVSPAWVASALNGMGFNVQSSGGGYVIMPAGGSTYNAPSSGAPKSSSQGSGLASVLNKAKTTAVNAATASNNNQGSFVNPNAGSGGSGGGGGYYDTGAADRAAAAASAAADLAERKREFDITTARDIAKQQGTEVDSLQQRLAALSGPKDAYADYFFAHGLLPPQGYKPAPVPLTQAQIDAYGRMGVTPQQLQQMIAGTGQPGANFGMLGGLGSALQPPAGTPPTALGKAPTQAPAPSNPTVQGGALFGMTPTVPGTGGTANAIKPPTTPGGVPSMAVGGQVPGPPGTPKLAVVHGGEEVTPAPQQGQNVGSQLPSPPQNGAMMNQPGLHPAISALVDAVSNLLSNPDFAPFVQATQQTTQATSGGVPSMALGGTVSPVAGSTPSPTASPLGPVPVTGAQNTTPNTTNPVVPDTSAVMPTANLDPYSKALYDVHGRLHPYSAQQQLQMGPAGLDAINSYISKVQGGDFRQYQDLADRLKPMAGAPQMGDVQSDSFTTG